MSDRRLTFTSRWGMLLVMLGMAVGTGNIWRFPRIAAANGGGSFLIPWLTFLFVWSVPLILVEFSMGKKARFGPVGAFAQFMGTRFAWMGAWVAWTAIAIMFYYAVVAGWTIRYFLAATFGQLGGANATAFWEGFAYSPAVLPYQALAFGIALFVVARGVRGIESAAKVLMPILLLLVVALAIRAVTLPGASRGLAFLFTPDLSELTNYRLWLEALTQNAWDTGAGWGLVLAYAVYLREREDTALNAFMVPIANNLVSLTAAIMVLATIFAIMPEAESQIVGAGNTGLTFIWVPQLFDHVPAGRVFMPLFFLALVFAAWTSLVAMVELAVRVLSDGGMTRPRALLIIAIVGLLLGVPSALNEQVFENQDFVWGVALMVSGLFFALAVLRYGVTRFRETLINTAHSDIRVGRWWDWVIRLVVVEALILIAWWFWQVRGEPLFGTYGIGSVLAQWGVALAAFLALNRWMVRKTRADVEREGPGAGELPAAR